MHKEERGNDYFSFMKKIIYKFRECARDLRVFVYLPVNGSIHTVCVYTETHTHTHTHTQTLMYPKVSGVAAWSENCKWYSSLLLGAVVSLFCESV
jgi:hypothetical protein